MKRLDQLTFTRFAMVLLVLFYHGTSGFYTTFLDFFPFSDLLRAAPTAVSYLYVLSGFVMSLVYYRPEQKFDFIGYWRARFIRIYPLYILAFALVCVYYADSIFRIKPQKILANIFVVQAWIPAYSQSFNYAAWSMTVEFFFYALFPFIMIWMYRQRTRTLIWVSILLWGVSQLIHFTLWAGYYPEYKEFIVYSPIFHLNSFVMGVTGGVWYLRDGQHQRIKPWTILSLIAGSFLFVAGYTVISSSVYPALPHDLQPMTGLLAPLMILFIVALAMDQSALSKILSHRVLVNLGETSYAIYILHVPVVWLYERALENAAMAGPYTFLQKTFLPIMIGIGLLAHFYVDVPLRKWLKTLLQRTSMRVLLLDIAILTFSVFMVFRLRFGEGREYQSYREMERLVFWVAFFARIILSLLFGAYNPANFQKPIRALIRPVLLSVTAGSFLMAVSAYIGYSTGWFENFPRSVFLYDWVIVLALSLLIRFGWRAMKTHKPDPISA